MPTPIQEYLREVERTYAPGNATEHTYRPAFKTLVESFGKNVRATNEPKRVACGAPDFIVAQPEVPIGFIECKDIGTPLDETEKTDQLKRYLAGLDNLILTDYLEFRYYVRGEQTMHVTLARIDGKGKIKSMQGADEQLAAMFDAFLASKAPTISTPKELADRMANVAKIIRPAIESALKTEDSTGTLHGELESFRQTILKDITPEQFADMYAQTVCYGMFSARVNVPDQKADTFTREHAAYDLPKTNPFLREVFDYVAGTKLDTTIVWAVDLLAEMLRRADMGEILKNFGKATRQEDPVVHFYETFLAAYDPKLRESRGVYYTPEPVVSFIVRSIDAILKRDFACPAGLADNSKITVDVPDTTKKSGKTKQEVHRVQILDPATGTGTFLYETIRHIENSLSANKGSWAGERGYVAQHLLPRLYGFELMMAPYAVAHLKLGWLLKETGYDFAADERLRVYLTNTLEEADVVAGPLLAFANQIAREANAAGKVKTDCPIMVVMGNPPYSGHSANQNQWSKDLIKKKLPLPSGAPGYFECDGEPLGERNPKWLNDDYVKFIRFGQYRIEQTGYGILAFITNHGYLDNPTFRGMRQSLMQTFDDIYILDLHGNAKKKETAPDGSKDENVFDIMQGVSLGIFVRRKERSTKSRVQYAHLYGKRESKYAWLNNNDITSTQWRRAGVGKPFYLYCAPDGILFKEYCRFEDITQAFPVNVLGFQTHRDHFAVDLDRDVLRKRICEMRSNSISDTQYAEKYDISDNRDWKLAEARRLIKADPEWESCLQQSLYRPFDIRPSYFSQIAMDFPRRELIEHVAAKDNLCLGVGRQGLAVNDPIWSLVACSRLPVDANVFRRGGINLFPLYLYPSGVSLLESSPWSPGKDGRRPNITPEFVAKFSGMLGLRFTQEGDGDLRKTFGPEDIFHYTYAIFNSPSYRKTYAEFLKVDFPRLPLTSDKSLFARLVRLGRELAGLHLLENVPKPKVTYPQAGSNDVTRTGKSAYKPPTSQTAGCVYINDSQYFDNVPPEVWGFHVGGYQVCEKWLKDRKDRTLSYDDIEHYRKTTEAIRQTIRLMDEIDAAIPSWPLV